mgnify:CR=1 FL=1
MGRITHLDNVIVRFNDLGRAQDMREGLTFHDRGMKLTNDGNIVEIPTIAGLTSLSYNK